MAALGPGAAPAAEPSVKFTVAGSRRPLTWDTGPGAGVDKLFMSRADSGPYGNPFRMPRGAAGEAYRDEVCEAHTEWLRLGNVPCIYMPPQSAIEPPSRHLSHLLLIAGKLLFLSWKQPRWCKNRLLVLMARANADMDLASFLAAMDAADALDARKT